MSAVRRELGKTHRGALDLDGEDEGDEDGADDERGLRVAEAMARSWAAWQVAEAELEADPDAFGRQSFGLIALGSLLKIIKDAENAEHA